MADRGRGKVLGQHLRAGINRLQREGYGVSAMARMLQLSRPTVYKYLPYPPAKKTENS